MRIASDDAPVWVNGEWRAMRQAGVRLSDPGLLAGLGLYETLGVREGRCLELEQHLARLEQGARHLDVPLPELPALRAAARRVARESAGECGWAKIVATRGGTCAVFGGTIDPSEVDRRATAILLDWQRSTRDPLAGYKTLNYAPFALGLEQARQTGADEGIWLNTRGHVAEGCASSLFVVQRRKLFTASIRDGILPGVTRALVLEAARRLGLLLHEGKLRLRRLETAHEAFLTSSVLGIRPLVIFNGRSVGSGEPGPITLSLAEELRRVRAEQAEAAVAGRRR